MDQIPSPRNNSGFLCTMAARRALTLLERNPKVNPERLGVYGHSMGGKLTVMTTGSDDRVKAAAPSCGGISDRYNDDPLFRATIGDDAYLERVDCPIMCLSPANDFHGRIDDLQTAVAEVGTEEWRVTCSPHHNHQDTAEYEVATQLWFDEHLKGVFVTPRTPATELDLKAANGIPTFTVRPDSAKPIASVDVYYTQQGQMDGEKDRMENTKARFWHHSPAMEQGGDWIAEAPILSTDRPLWIYANVTYALDEPIIGAGYYYASYTAGKFTLSSLMSMVKPSDLTAAKVKATRQVTTVIETFEGDWEKQWFTYKPDDWPRKTHKVYDPEWAAPAGAKLAIEVQSDAPNKLVIGIDSFVAEVALEGGGEWQSIVLAASEFRNLEGEPLSGWGGIKELRLAAEETLRGKPSGENRTVGAAWEGKAPRFRNLRWQN